MQMMAHEKQYHDELKMELQGVQYSAAISKVDKQSSDQESEGGEDSALPDQQIADDNANLSKVVMSRKKRKLYEAMQVITSFLFLHVLLFFLRFS